MGPLLFVLTYQPTLHAAQEHAADAVVTACHDDTYLQGQENAVVAGARRIMSRHACQPRRTLVHCADPDRARNVAAKLGATVATDGIVACGTALGSDAFIAQHIQQRCDSTCARVDKLFGLPLDPQTKWSVLHNCLQHRAAHLMQNTWWHLLAAPLRQVKDALVRGMCDIIDVTSLTDQQRVQLQLLHRHGGTGLRRFSEDVATVACLTSAALAHEALARGCDKALPFGGAMGLEAHSSLAWLHEAWPTVKGLADSLDDAAEWAGRKPDGKALRMAARQRVISHSDADARTAALFATLEADAKGASSQARSADLADLARLRSCAGSLASAWLTAWPGPAELTAVEFDGSRVGPVAPPEWGSRGGDMWVRSLGAMEGRWHSRGGGGVGDAGSCAPRVRRHVPTSGGRRRGAGGEGWESQRVAHMLSPTHNATPSPRSASSL